MKTPYKLQTELDEHQEWFIKAVADSERIPLSNVVRSALLLLEYEFPLKDKLEYEKLRTD